MVNSSGKYLSTRSRFGRLCVAHRNGVIIGPTHKEVSRTFGANDSANSEATLIPSVWNPRSMKWIPLIMGAKGEGGTDSDKSGGTGTDKPDDTDDDKSGGKDDKDEEKKFTQADVDKLIGREKSIATRGKVDPSELGFQSKKELEEFLEAKRKEDEDKKTEDQKALEDAKKAAKEEAEKSVLLPAQRMLMKADFKLGAVEAGIPKSMVEDAFLIAQSLESWKGVEIKDGAVTGLDEDFFAKFKEEKPHFFPEGSSDQGAGDIGAGAGGGKGKKPDLEESKLRSRYSGLGTKR